MPPLPDSYTGTVRRVQVPQGKKLVALTFDACELQTSVSGFDRELVTSLRHYGAHATFFVGGKWMRSHPEPALQLLATPGFELANHAWSHGNFGIMDLPTAEKQILWTQAAYEKLYALLRKRTEQAGHPEYMQGIAPSMRLFRLPYGRCRAETLKLLNTHGLQVIQWDICGEEEKDNTVKGAAQKIAAKIHSGSIVLLHANLVPHGTATLTAQLVPLLQSQGYTLVNVSELLQAGTAVRVQEGYFNRLGDNLSCDTRFGKDGTGALHKQ
ncbi:MAG: polysaccharide deacetylase family protein [Desulfovibrionaceae bacterium]